MISRRVLLGGAVGTGVLALTPTGAAHATGVAEARNEIHEVSANGWRIDPAAIAVHRIEGSTASVALRRGPAAGVLLHVARRWHYEIGPVDTGEGGGVAGYAADRVVRTAVESNYLSGTAIALHPTAYPLGGSESLWPHQEAVVRDILADCEGTVVWGGDLSPATASHFHVATRPGDRALARVAVRLGPGVHVARRTPTVVTG
ncbi:hypothetical protein [Solwaraspora sp. WMMD792]|uniref:hypothetical protein n=1 Tax=Solwaraspora sp. WMMD792 TaxID=3016099 RepID=UPI0024169862|nr:hypothetical protein [Solwaraspora sp. WMMD792]MDG4770264.1 hypothetical protein [Solwaraspora sp. WMMD792]